MEWNDKKIYAYSHLYFTIIQINLNCSLPGFLFSFTILSLMRRKDAQYPYNFYAEQTFFAQQTCHKSVTCSRFWVFSLLGNCFYVSLCLNVKSHTWRELKSWLQIHYSRELHIGVNKMFCEWISIWIFKWSCTFVQTNGIIFLMLICNVMYC